ncbi:MAG: hypothetical protein QW616_05605, partial [Thermoplasmata archaeon]
LFFIILNYYFYGINASTMDFVLYFIIGIAILLVLSFMLTFFIFSLLIFDLLMILHTFFFMDLNSIYTWIIAIIISIIIYLILRHIGKKLEKSVFKVDNELKGVNSYGK